MTNTKQLTGALTLLASVAILDNFIFIESDPDFDSMVLIEPNASMQDEENGLGPNTMTAGLQKFWIDQDKVSSTDFAKFIEATGYEPQLIAPTKMQAVAVSNEYSAYVVAKDPWQSQVDNADWKETAASHSMNSILSGEDDLLVSFEDALAYCNWLGKELSTSKQSQQFYSANQTLNSPSTSEFRCAKNI